ncbi:MAG: hypothetical protein WAS33_07270, partial [Candidatus Promineifilaceae bacterium]
MRSRFLAIFGSIVLSTVVLVSLALNGRVAAESEGLGGATPPTTVRISEPVPGEEANGDSTTPAISANGRFMAFASKAENLDPLFVNNFLQDIFIKDLETQVITRVVAFAQTGAPNGESRNPDISANGRFIVFETDATDFASQMELFDDNAGPDIYIYDRDNEFLDIISANWEQFEIANGPSYTPAVAAAGDVYRVVFVSEATNLHPNDTDTTPDIYVATLSPSSPQPLEMKLVSVNSLGVKGNAG